MKYITLIIFTILISFKCFAETNSATPQAQIDQGFEAIEAGNYEKAFRLWYEVAVKFNDAPSQVNIAGMYRDGQGVEKNYQNAIEWYEKAIEQEHPLAYYGLGVMYEQGWGVEANPLKAAELWIFPANKGHVQSIYNLGIFFYTRTDNKKEKGLSLLKLAAEKGYQPAVEALEAIKGK